MKFERTTRSYRKVSRMLPDEDRSDRNWIGKAESRAEPRSASCSSDPKAPLYRFTTGVHAGFRTTEHSEYIIIQCAYIGTWMCLDLPAPRVSDESPVALPLDWKLGSGHALTALPTTFAPVFRAGSARFNYARTLPARSALEPLLTVPGNSRVAAGYTQQFGGFLIFLPWLCSLSKTTTPKLLIQRKSRSPRNGKPAPTGSCWIGASTSLDNRS